MRALIREHGQPTFRRTGNAFQSLARAIIYQQLHGAAAGTIYGRFRQLFPGRPFPTPAQVVATRTEKLRSVGLSQAKERSIRDLATRFAAGEIVPRRFSRMSDDEIAEVLTAVRGIGRWTVDMFLIFGLNRPDVLPVGDYAVQRGMALYFRKRGALKAPQMAALAENWRPYRSVGSWYMWRVVEFGLPMER